jgi:hypothetical protein
MKNAMAQMEAHGRMEDFVTSASNITRDQQEKDKFEHRHMTNPN